MSCEAAESAESAILRMARVNSNVESAVKPSVRRLCEWWVNSNANTFIYTFYNILVYK